MQAECPPCAAWPGQHVSAEAMTDAVEDAAVVCYGISQAYKESTNCRMEAQYVHRRALHLLDVNPDTVLACL